MMLTLAKRAVEMHSIVKDGKWAHRLSMLPYDLFGKTVLIVGFGRIGTRTAKRCLAMEMNVLIYDPYKPAAEIKAAGCEPVNDLDAALPRADFVSVHCPKTPETVGMFNAARLQRMKPSAYLINTARGGIVDEQALYQTLVSGKLAGAGLDVFEQEPPPSGHRLFELPNVIMAPHDAGGGRPDERANRAQHPERARWRANPPERHQSGRTRLIALSVRRFRGPGIRIARWPSANMAIMTGSDLPNSSARSRSRPGNCWTRQSPAPPRSTRRSMRWS
jgi:phosphoglycerate dehydrogenase-like enzyme